MYARLTALQMAPPRVDAARDQLEEQIVTALKGQEGFVRFQLLVDRKSGRAIGLSWWETEEALTASARAMEEARRKAIDIGGAVGQPDVQAYEVVLDTQA